MQHFRCSEKDKVMLVAMSSDRTRAGGLAIFGDGGRKIARLECFIKIGDLAAAVFRTRCGTNFVMTYNALDNALDLLTTITDRDLTAYTERDGIFWTLPK